MEKQVIFKKATVGGFDKKAVLSYIDELDQKFNETKQQLEEQLALLEEENNRLTEEISRMGEEAEQNAVKLEEQLNKNKELSSLTDTLNSEIGKQKCFIEEKEREIQVQIEHGNQLQKKIEELQLKNQKYDDASLQIGALLLDADKMAKDIVGKAEIKAKQIDSDMIRNSEDAREKFSAFKNELACLRMRLNSGVQAFQNELDELESLAVKAEKMLPSEALKLAQEDEIQQPAEKTVSQENTPSRVTFQSNQFFR